MTTSKSNESSPQRTSILLPRRRNTALVYKLAKTKRCPYCGTLVNDMEPPRYDAHGPSMQPIASNSSVGKAYCPKCGAENSSDAVYCNACGEKIKE